MRPAPGPDFLRAAEAITGAPISWGNDVELLINGDRIFPRYLETLRGAQRTLCLLTYVYWRGEIADEVADALCERARGGRRVQRDHRRDRRRARWSTDLVERMIGRRACASSRFRPPKPYAVRRLENRTHRKIRVADGRSG